MTNYKETQITASKYQRARFVTITNDKGTNPFISFVEEQIVVLDDGSFVKNECGLVGEVLTVDNATEQFDILNDDGTVSGQSTYQDVYKLLSSLYIHMATKRDAINVAQPIVVEPVAPVGEEPVAP